MKRLSLSLVLLATFFQSIAQKKEPVLVTDLLRIKTAGNITLTKDGRQAAFTLTSIEPAENSTLDHRYTTQIYTMGTEGSDKPAQLTFSKERASQPAWSPDGKQLAFVRTVEGRPQIFILPMQGGEAWQLTTFKYGASQPRWSPDGRKIIFATSIPLREMLRDSLLNPRAELPLWSSEKPGFPSNAYLKTTKVKADPNGSVEEVRAYLAKNEVDNKARVITKLNFQSETDISTESDFGHFFIVTVQQGNQPRPLTKGFYRYGALDFTPDGRNIVFTAQMDSVQHPDRALESSILTADTAGRMVRLLLGGQGKSYFSPRISPDGKWLIYLQSSTSFVSVPTISLLSLQSANATPQTITFDRVAGNFTWSDDGSYVYFTAQSNGGVPLYRLHVPTKKIEQLTDYNSGISSFDLAGNKIVFAKTEAANPSEVYLTDGSLKAPRQVSSFNGWVAGKQLSLPQKHSFTNAKGMQVEYWVMKPAFYESGKKYPVLLEIHGGPSAMWGPGEASMWHEFQYFASKGYGVVYGNPRGSGGYGLEFLRGNINDWGAGPTSDVLTSLDRTVAEGWADTSKLVVSGGSYAGYLVAWIIAHDKRFKAACSQRGVYDLATFFGEGNAWRLVPNYFGGYPWEADVRTVLNRESPINYVHNITTPYIIFHGDNDRRTGFVQSEMLYRSLKVLGRPVEYVRHPNATHEITRTGDNRQRIDQMLRTWEFFERWIK